MPARETRPARTAAEENDSQKRSEVLSVKASPVEKDMILRASAQYDMPYSEFVRYVSLAACRSMGIEERPNVEVTDVRKRRGTPRALKSDAESATASPHASRAPALT